MKKLLAAFLLCVGVDIFGKNGYLLFTDQTKAYWILQSISFLCYIVLIALLCNYIYHQSGNVTALLLCIASTNWIVFAIGDLIDEVTGTFDKSSWYEYIAFIVVIPYSIYLWKTRT